MNSSSVVVVVVVIVVTFVGFLRFTKSVTTARVSLYDRMRGYGETGMKTEFGCSALLLMLMLALGKK